MNFERVLSGGAEQHPARGSCSSSLRDFPGCHTWEPTDSAGEGKGSYLAASCLPFLISWVSGGLLSGGFVRAEGLQEAELFKHKDSLY